jgi:co-chaperonin GroES (HSP10)
MPKALEMVHDTDPKQEIWGAIGDAHKDFIALGADVLVATYERPKKTKSGIILTDFTTSEDHFQGKIGLVVAKGPLAFTEDDEHKWPGRKPEVGDWVVFFPLSMSADAIALYIGKQPMRIIRERDIRGIVDDPDLVW